MGQTIFAQRSKILRLLFIGLYGVFLSAQPGLAESKTIKDQFTDWLLESVAPQDPSNPNCSEGGRDYIGHIGTRDSVHTIDAMIARACAAKANPRTGHIPFAVHGCYTLAILPEFLSPPTPEQQCYCDYFFCDPSHYEPFEDAVDLAVTVINTLDL